MELIVFYSFFILLAILIVMSIAFQFIWSKKHNQWMSRELVKRATLLILLPEVVCTMFVWFVFQSIVVKKNTFIEDFPIVLMTGMILYFLVIIMIVYVVSMLLSHLIAVSIQKRKGKMKK